MRDEDKTRDQLLDELRALRESEARLRAFVDHSPTVAFMKDEQGRFVYFNRAIRRYFDREPGELLGQTDFDLVPPESARMVREHDDAVLAAGRMIEWDEPVSIAGRVHHMRVFKFPFRDGAGRRFLGGVAVDVSESRRTEETLRRSEALLAEAQRLAHVGSWERQLPSNSVTWSEELYRIFGLDPEPAAPSYETFLARVHPEDRERVASVRDQVLRGPSSFDQCYRIVRPDGSVRIVHSRGQVIVDEMGQPIRVIGAAEDVTDRRRAEEALQESHALLRAVVEGVPHAIYVKDRQSHYLLANSAAARFLNKRSEEMLGRDDTAWFDPESARRFQEMDRRVMETEEIATYEETGTAAGVTRTYLTTKAPYRGPRGEVLGILGISQDVTERRQAEQSQREQAARLEALSRRLVQVQEQERRHLARELHDEVGQSLTALQLVLERGAREPAGTARNTLDEARVMAGELLAQVRELSLDLRPALLDDFGLVPTLLWHFERYTMRTGVRVSFRRAGAERRFPPELETATYRIMQEALTNVARHARVSEVVVRLWSAPEALYVQVEDQGTGFDPDASGGASSGLNGMRERAGLLGGQLTVESAPGAGTRVTAELPLRESLTGPRKDGGQ